MKIKKGIIQAKEIYGVPFVVDLIPASNRYRRDNTNTIKDWLTAHNTGNPAGDARMHTNYVDKEIGYINWHFTVDDEIIYQELPIHEACYASGDGGKGKGNLYSIQVEICETGNWKKARTNALKLFIFLFKNVDSLIGDDWFKTLVPHQKWSGKYCPRIILSEQGGFNKFVKDGWDLMKTLDDNSNIVSEPITNWTWKEIGKLEKAINYNVNDAYWIKGFNEGTLTRYDVAFIINKLANKVDINDALKVFKQKGWTNSPDYWLGVVNGAHTYKRVYLNTLINNALR